MLGQPTSVRSYHRDVPTPELEQQLTLLARRLAKPIRLHGPSGFTVLDRSAYQTLSVIVDAGPMRATALAKLVGLDLSVVSRHLKALQDAGFVQRNPDPQDARAALVSVTGSGRAAFEMTQQQRTEVIDEVTATWSTEDRESLVRLLTRFTAELEASIARRLAADAD